MPNQSTSRDVYAPHPRDARLSCIAQARDVLNHHCRKNGYSMAIDHIAGESLRKMVRVSSVDVRAALNSAQSLADTLAKESIDV